MPIHGFIDSVVNTTSLVVTTAYKKKQRNYFSSTASNLVKLQTATSSYSSLQGNKIFLTDKDTLLVENNIDFSQDYYDLGIDIIQDRVSINTSPYEGDVILKEYKSSSASLITTDYYSFGPFNYDKYNIQKKFYTSFDTIYISTDVDDLTLEYNVKSDSIKEATLSTETSSGGGGDSSNNNQTSIKEFWA